MAIKSTKLGGTDYADGNVLLAVDQNDTNDAIIENDLRKIYSANGFTTTNPTQEEIDSVVIPAGTFTVNDVIIIKVFGSKTGTGGTPLQSFIRIADGTNTFTSTNLVISNVTVDGDAEFKIFQRDSINTGLAYNAIGNFGTIRGEAGVNTMIPNWMTAEMTVSLRGLRETDGTGYLRWAIYKRVI